jgi:hypothetical protein
MNGKIKPHAWRTGTFGIAAFPAFCVYAMQKDIDKPP